MGRGANAIVVRTSQPTVPAGSVMNDAGRPLALGMVFTSLENTIYRWLALNRGWQAVIVNQASVGEAPGCCGTGAMTST